ncbi:MAG: lysophospholipid acyltransferase family protein, partial [Deltaproteobacteria bacterium]|nr:lysophospholipid acyltransferase family protein [Deltaproteobacteria bacterium]
EMMGASQSLMGIPVNAVVRDIHFGPAHALWNELRHTTGMKTIAPRNSQFQIRAALKRGEAVAFLIDQHMPKTRGIVCSFFGRLASTSPAPVRFAMMTGAPVVPVVIYRDGAPGHHVVEFHPVFSLETPHAEREQNIWHNTERLNRIIEAWVRRAPEQWLWVHRRWKVHDKSAGWDIPEALRSLVGRRY